MSEQEVGEIIGGTDGHCIAATASDTTASSPTPSVEANVSDQQSWARYEKKSNTVTVTVTEGKKVSLLELQLQVMIRNPLPQRCRRIAYVS